MQQAQIGHLLVGVLALGCFIISAWQFSSPVWNRIVSVGLAFLTLAVLPW